MLVILNDIAFNFKFENKYDAVCTMKELIELIIELKKSNSTFRIYKSCRLEDIELAKEYFLSQFLNEPKEVIDRKYLSIFKTYMKNTNKMQDGKGTIEYKGFFSKQCAASYENNGFLLSLKTNEEFNKEIVGCNYFRNESDKKEYISIKNLSKIEHIQVHRHDLPIRIYEFNPKHKINGGWGSKMDLSDETAQKVLDEAIVANDASKHLIAKYDGKYYSFRCHWDNYYHGYRDDSMPQNLKNRLDTN